MHPSRRRRLRTACPVPWLALDSASRRGPSFFLGRDPEAIMYGPTTLPEERLLRKVTVPATRDPKANGQSIAMVTAYDFTMARLLDEAGVGIILVGDSLGMVVQGLANTLPVTVDEICYHGRAVARGLRRAHLVGDMPF